MPGQGRAKVEYIYDYLCQWLIDLKVEVCFSWIKDLGNIDVKMFKRLFLFKSDNLWGVKFLKHPIHLRLGPNTEIINIHVNLNIYSIR